jgi:hypothetical protein
MRALTGELLLTACEEAAEEHDLNRSLVLLSHAIPKSNRRELARLSIAERNLLLLRLRELSFGSLLQGFGACPQCGAHLEFELPVASLIERLQSHSSPGPITWSENGRHCQLRPVTTDDLLSILDMPGIREAQDRLLELCLSVSGSLAKPSACSTTDSLLEKFEQLHAAAELSCTLRCPECSVSETLDLDIARFLWIEARSAAQRLLAEIHELAWAYGWSERSIARMSPQRRSAYLEMLSA